MDLHDYLKEHLSVPVVAALGAPLGLSAAQAARIADEALPSQLSALEGLARTPEGAQHLLDLARDRIPQGDVLSLTGSPEAMTRLEHSGAGLLPEVMGSGVSTEVQRLAASSGTDAATVRRMMERLLPVLLSLIAQRAASSKLTAATLGTLFGGAALIGGGAAVGGAVASSTVISSAATVVPPAPEVLVSEVLRPAPVAAPPEPVVRPAEEEPRRRTPVWWWLLPLALLLGSGGCYLSQRNQTQTALGDQAALALTRPAEGERVSGPVQLSGSARAGETVTISENGASLATAQVGQDGTFSATLPAPAAGPHTYSVTQSGTPETTLSRSVTAAAVAASTAPSSAAVSSASSVVSSAAASTASSAVPSAASSTDQPSTTPSNGAAGLTFTAPAGGSSVPAGALRLSGTGPADTDLSVTEDGNTLGTARTDASGNWSFSVPSPAAGAHTYTATAGTLSSDLKLTVAAGSAQAGRCTKDFSLSLNNGAQVKQPFRFGGVGSGKSYVVTVSRGSRQIGQKVLPLDASCGWSYTSRPGAGRITYALKQSGQSAVASTVTLNVTR